MDRLTCKELAFAWEIGVTKVTAARNPAFMKVAKAIVMYNERAMAELSEYCQVARIELEDRFERERSQQGKAPAVLQSNSPTVHTSSR